MKTLVAYEPHTLGYSPAKTLWNALPEGRKVDIDQEAHVVLYDEVHKAIQGFTEDRTVLRIVVAMESPRDLPKGIFWIKPDIGVVLSLIRALNPGK
jgi:hypothetical protein